MIQVDSETLKLLTAVRSLNTDIILMIGELQNVQMSLEQATKIVRLRDRILGINRELANPNGLNIR